ncbi:hypothetical protein K443DRAFT_681942 [Laccaria amethystina LaAM-08-1]|uniref:Uncharacterized protein n=1 Tax=Laccaria amethystina LaAM-08-1 TaxID=1095629 RepID=A0A0C9WL18_9AGAR|nr:hypothetical protein K443DRAFT_681942 [Laccaria amethystina LaAM-08-1]
MFTRVLNFNKPANVWDLRSATPLPPSVVISGQLGIAIGKSFWIYYAIRRYVAEEKPYGKGFRYLRKLLRTTTQLILRPLSGLWWPQARALLHCKSLLDTLRYDML